MGYVLLVFVLLCHIMHKILIIVATYIQSLATIICVEIEVTIDAKVELEFKFQIIIVKGLL